MTRALTLIFSVLLFSCSNKASCQEPTGDQLDQQVHWILKNKCSVCHDELGDEAASGVGDLLELEGLYEYYLDPTDEELLNDLLLGDDARMPKPKYDDVAWNGPLTKAEKATLREWIHRGGASDEYASSQEAEPRKMISLREMMEAMASDLQTLSGTKLENARYLTLTNLHNRNDVSEDELEIYRAAIVKTLNSLSQSPDVLGLDTSTAAQKLVAVDSARTIFRFDLRHIGWDRKKWDRVAQHYPFAIEVREGTGNVVYELTSSELPYLRADWFVFATLQPPLYHEMVEIPPTLAQLEQSLGIERFREIRNRNVARSGMIESKVSDYNRLLERIPFRGGGYHLSYDNGSNDGESNFMDFPFGPKGVGLTNKYEFKHDGGEAIYNLPNGYQAYMLVDAEGQRLDVAPSSIVQDGTMPRDAIINGISCLSCHFQGMKPEKYSPRLAQLDVLREEVSGNFVRFTSDERELVKELYPPHAEFEQLIENDRERFLRALEESGIPQRGATEPARELFNRFKRDLDTEGLAAEFGMNPDEFRERMSRETETRQLLRVSEQGIFDRQRVFSQFARIARLVGLAEVRTSKPLPFPYFAEETMQFAKNDAVQAAANPTVGSTGVSLVDAENRDGQLQVQLWTADQRQSYEVGDLLEVRVRANEDCFLTLISVDSVGELTLLMPNAFHGQFRMRKNQTVTIPTPQMDFEFIAQPPTGPTIVKAIVCKRPLPLRDITIERLNKEIFPSLGRAKGFNVRKREQPPERSSEEILSAPLTLEEIGNIFSRNEWATASISVVIRPK
ncbi:DUF4384 domain-containing protein [Thalassoglobus polymorphus]|uniref:DUF4384 domain-containing protein n=1 Tax=Thalassoglobus polymorphus TaxID=2527994 RepID=A0A517QMS8_9PLAN|nr:DUF4384 domain-containing protein [Thalassoglobus polymorphus]QDT32950.1 hypothetical protein Mal48_22000 [Thalassoglobus polymorphus]